MRIASYGWREIISLGIILFLVGVILFHIYYLLVLVPLVLFGFVLYFFRDPHRIIPQGDKFILAPADGRVVEVTELYEPDFINNRAIKIGIFMSLFNAHITRSPCGGRVVWLSYQPGKFKIASHQDSARVNERNSIGLSAYTSEKINILVRQIAGVVARRIVCVCQENDLLVPGEKIGMIKFGSRVEVYIPKEKLSTLLVRLGDKTRAGETILGYLK